MCIQLLVNPIGGELNINMELNMECRYCQAMIVITCGQVPKPQALYVVTLQHSRVVRCRVT